MKVAQLIIQNNLNHKKLCLDMSLEIQKQIKNNAMQLKEYVKGLHDWEQEMEYKEKIKTQKRNQEQRKRQELQKEQQRQEQQQKKIEQSLKKSEKEPAKKKELIRDVNTVQDYYKAWDQYDVDKQLQKLEEEEMAKYRPYNPYEDSKNNKRAKPKSGIVVKGNRNANMVKDPTSMKDKGNLHFKVSEFDKAISCYSDCLTKIDERQLQIKGKDIEESEKDIKDRKKLKAVVLSNRAMAYLKIRQTAKALLDCNDSLKYDDRYLKTYLRRADCYKRLGYYRNSLKDYQTAKQISPSEKQADIQIKKIEAFMSKKVKETHDNMIVDIIPEAIPSGYRIQIEDVEQFEESDGEKGENKEESNYLEQL